MNPYADLKTKVQAVAQQAHNLMRNPADAPDTPSGDDIGLTTESVISVNYITGPQANLHSVALEVGPTEGPMIIVDTSYALVFGFSHQDRADYPVTLKICKELTDFYAQGYQDAINAMSNAPAS